MIDLPEKFGSKSLITAVKITKIWRSSGESNKLKYVYPIWGTPREIAIQKREIDYVKSKIGPFILNFVLFDYLLKPKIPCRTVKYLVPEFSLVFFFFFFLFFFFWLMPAITTIREFAGRSAARDNRPNFLTFSLCLHVAFWHPVTISCTLFLTVNNHTQDASPPTAFGQANIR